MWLGNFSFPSLPPQIRSTFFTSIYTLCPTPTQTSTHTYAQPYTHTYTHNAFFHPSCPGKAGIDGARLQHPLRRAAAPIQPPRAHPAVLTFCFSPPEQAAGALNWHRDLGYPGRAVLIQRKASRRVSVLDSRTGTATSCILEKQPGPLLFDDGERKRFWLLCSSPEQGDLIS